MNPAESHVGPHQVGTESPPKSRDRAASATRTRVSPVAVSAHLPQLRLAASVGEASRGSVQSARRLRAPGRRLEWVGEVSVMRATFWAGRSVRLRPPSCGFEQCAPIGAVSTDFSTTAARPGEKGRGLPRRRERRRYVTQCGRRETSRSLSVAEPVSI